MVIQPGSGTFSVESVIGSAVKSGTAHEQLVVACNGAYGRRICTMATRAGINHKALDFGEAAAVDAEVVATAVVEAPEATHLAFVHHETTSGILNDAEAIASAAKRARAGAGLPPIRIILDSMSAFGAYEVPMSGAGAWDVDFVVSSSNKCIEGVPGFGFTLARIDALNECRGIAPTLSLDLYDQWEALERTGQFRFTPPVQVLAAFRQALVEHELEGGSAARLARYSANYARLVSGMQAIGFCSYVDPAIQGSIIATFLQPEDPAFSFDKLYGSLAANGMVIYPGKLTDASCFRIGSIGRLFESDIDALLGCIEKEVSAMGVQF